MSEPTPIRPSAIFGARLRAARKARDLSLEQVARALSATGRSVSKASLVRLERGERDPGLDEALALAWWFSASPTAWLTPRDDEALQVGEHDALDPPTAQEWLRYGLGGAGRWRARIAEDVLVELEKHARRAERDLSAAQNDAARKAVRAALDQALVKLMVRYRAAQKRLVDKARSPVGWDGLPTVRETDDGR
jgi:transcriptional regulator with XRE-family HTH domain